MGKRRIIVVAVMMLVVGIGVLCYPVVSQLINQWNDSYAIQAYQSRLDHMDDPEKNAELEKARIYNEQLRSSSAKMEELKMIYDQTLDFGNGIMGYIQIPQLAVKLPIYHGVSSEVLEKGVGHLPTSALPIMEDGNHTVLTGHTGLSGAALFTDLDKLQEGDWFYVTVADLCIAYRVDQIKVVLPDESADLQPIPGSDYCTLVTCAPYGVNSHRLLVRGLRADAQRMPAE